ncbi:hypothetical protein B0H14DRAFT_2645958 [Mycena olivaceomarginata]|nr:hypothetical protein B0H14DRAFT_2645958 [Mycena olivaceomarginata]
MSGYTGFNAPAVLHGWVQCIVATNQGWTRTYVDRHGLLALTNHYIPLKQQAGAKYMPGILAEGSSQATTTSRRRTTTPTPRSPTGWFPDVGLFTSKTAANSQCGPDVEGRWKQHAREKARRGGSHKTRTTTRSFPTRRLKTTATTTIVAACPCPGLWTMAPATASPPPPQRHSVDARTFGACPIRHPHIRHPRVRHPRVRHPRVRHPRVRAPTRSTAVRSPDSIIEDDDIVEIGVRQRSGAPVYLRFERHLVKSEEPLSPPPPVKIEEAPFVVKQEDRKPKFKSRIQWTPRSIPPRVAAARVPEVRKTPQHRLDPNDTDFYFLSDSPNTSLDTEASLDASPTRSPTEAAAHPPAAASSPRPMDAPTRSPTEAAVRAPAAASSSPPHGRSHPFADRGGSQGPRPCCPTCGNTYHLVPPHLRLPGHLPPVSARAPTTVGATAPAPALAHAPAPALACESTASPARMAARELNSRAGVHLAPPAVLAPALELVSASDGRSTTRSGERPDPARERTVPDSFSPVPRSTIDMPQPMQHRAPVTYATPARSICVRGSESPSRHNSKSPNPGPFRSRKRNASSSPDFYGVGVRSSWSLELSVRELHLLPLGLDVFPEIERKQEAEEVPLT